ncbi:glycosyltransferase family 4 protein [Pseudarthrobacter niigatensis]|uniref:Glycosyltransferase involved in cell wall biosynthesis n=1 Tax=Pseudarthrobacter niigatensis TaxID=369935 RepID=A0AAJ1WDB7_9MICC|nr:glycosyltransferase family 4 protein [Pseudarthrobacter niigatensis]MDQ0145994.1 glycosyltransferase involved in cell wall biosynthesis [Pseudarthrobacter niigatensis]MDQ0266278.1 glycosyltransferase involved in cell wall biosynthesis [Pseudarthrobacter niigatensis]
MKVLFVHPSNELYGADKVLLAIIDALPLHYCAEVWLPTDIRYPGDRLRRELEARSIPVAFIDLPVLRRSYFNARGILKLLPRMVTVTKHLRSADFDLLYINTSALASVAPLGRMGGKPVVLHLHEYLSGITKFVLQPFLIFASLIIGVSEAVRDALPVGSRSRSVVIYNGFDLPTGELQVTGQKLRFVLASRWNAWKGHEALLKAWSNLKRADVELHVYGGPPEVGQSVDVRAIVERMPNRETVKICGHVEDIKTALLNCDAVLVPSVNPDPLPTIAIEAAAYGRAVLASRSGGLKEIVEDKVTGWLLTPGVSEEWTACLETLSAEDLVNAGNNARALFAQKFNQQAFAERIRVIFQRYENEK